MSSYFLRERQLDQLALACRLEGLAALKSGEVEIALVRLRRCLRRFKDDPAALSASEEARRRLELLRRGIDPPADMAQSGSGTAEDRLGKPWLNLLEASREESGVGANAN